MEGDDPFCSIRHNRNTKLDNQQKALSVLDAVDRTLQERQLEPSLENYFLALWPILERAEGMTGTVVYLCSFVIPKLPSAFIQEHYGELYARLPAVFQEGLGDGPLVRSALGCLRAVLGAFGGAEAWQERPSLQELLSLALGLCLDERPKVRKLAQDCVAGTFLNHVAHVHAGLTVALQFIKMVLQGATRKESTRALHLAPLLRRLVPGLDQSSLDGLLGPVLQCCSLGSTHLSVLLFGFLEEVCKTTEEAADGSMVPVSRLVQLNLSQTKKIVEGLTRMKPSMELADLAAAWTTAYGYALAHPANAGRLDVASLVPGLLEALGSPHERVHLACQVACSQLSGPASAMMAPLLLARLQQATTETVPYLLAIVRDQIMLLEERCIEPYAEIVSSIASLYDRKGFGVVKSDVTKAIGDFIRVFGSGPVLAVIPLGLTSTSQNRAWLLPVLKEAVNNDSLAYFITDLLPLADALQAKSDAFRAQEKLTDAKVYETVVYQIWSCLPSYMRYATDFAMAFPQLAPRLAGKMTEDPVLRPMLVNALAQTIGRMRTLQDDLDVGCLTLLRPVGDADADRQVIAGLAGNLLPVLFNLLGVTASEQRAALLDSIRALLEVGSPATVQDYFNRTLALLHSNTSEAATLLELLTTMVRFLELPAHQHLCESALPILEQATDAGLQKAAYKALHYALSHEMYGPSLLDWTRLEAVLLHAAAPLVDVGAVRKCRFRLLLGLIPQLPDSELFWIPALLPETVLGIKETNQKARLLAFELLLAMARRMARGGLVRGAPLGLPSDTPASLDEFVTMVLAGLAGRTPHMISATVVALARLLFDMAGAIPPQTIQALLGDILLLLGSPSRELVKASFGFLKVAIIVLSPEALAPHLSTLVASVLAWSSEHALHFKVRVRHLMERLIRRFGYDAVYAAVPEEHRRLVINIRKRKERLRRRNTTSDQPEDDGEEVNMEDLAQAALSTGKTSMMTRRGVSSSAQATRPSARFEAALHDSDSDLGDSEDGDNGDEDVVMDHTMGDDDLETALSRKLSLRSAATRATLKKTSPAPKEKKKTREEQDFKTNAEGKMIIEESDQEIEDDDGIVVDENAHRLYAQSLKTFTRPGKHVKFSQKRSRDGSDDEDAGEGGEGVGYDAASRMTRASRLSKVSRRPAATATAGKHSGAEFRAKRAKGDAKAKGAKHEPYAYVPLQRAQGKAKTRYFLSK